MQRQKYHIILFFLSIPFPFMLFKGWWSDVFEGWGTQGYIYLGLFAVLAEIYFSPRKLVVSGMITISIYLIGLALYFMHWSGAQILLLLGITGTVLIPFLGALQNPKQRTLNIIISLWILIYGAGVMFQNTGWPGRGLVFISSILFLPVVTAALGLTFWKNKTAKA